MGTSLLGLRIAARFPGGAAARFTFGSTFLVGVMGVGVMGVGIMGCSSQGLLAIMPGVVNDPENRTLRQEILAEAAPEMCAELLRRNVPLRLRQEDPGSGRLYPNSCQTRPIANGNLQVDFSARGFAWTNMTKRVGVAVSASVEYETDFQLDGSTMYVYFRHRSTVAKKLDITMIEAPVPNAIGTLLPGAQQMVAPLAEGVLEKELTRGFTVVRDSDGYATFAFGVLPVGQRPPAPFERRSRDRQVLANERIEVHEGQRDFLGPFDVEDEDMALFLTIGVEGAPAADLLVVTEVVGGPWLETYLTRAGASAAPGLPIHDEAVPAGPLLRRAVRVPQGRTYVVIDNTSTAGRTAEAGAAGDDRAAFVTLGVELDDAP